MRLNHAQSDGSASGPEQASLQSISHHHQLTTVQSADPLAASFKRFAAGCSRVLACSFLGAELWTGCTGCATGSFTSSIMPSSSSAPAAAEGMGSALTCNTQIDCCLTQFTKAVRTHIAHELFTRLCHDLQRQALHRHNQGKLDCIRRSRLVTADLKSDGPTAAC